MATLRQLEIFAVTAEHKKMSSAAKQLFISQSSISQTISELENEYGVVLFERKSRELRITEVGKLFLERAKKIVELNQSLDMEMKNLKSIRPLRIGATLTIGPTILTKLIKTFKDKYPDVDVYVKVTNTTHIEMLLLNNELDVALVEGIIQNPAITSEAVFEDNLCLICGKNSPFFRRDEVSISELNKCSFILREKGSGTRAIFESIMRNFQIDYHVQWESISMGAIIDAVINDFGIAVLSVREASKLSPSEVHMFRIKEHNFKRYFFTTMNAHRFVNSQAKDWCDFVKSLPEDYQ